VAARRFMGTVTHFDTQETVAALTFDDGPHPDSTPRLLEILRRHDAHGTFFMVGISASAHPEQMRKVAEAGHAVCNHSWDHPSFPFIASDERRRQIRACEKALAPYGQRFFRPPYGEQSLASRIDAWRLGYRVVTWSANSADWCEPDPARIVESLMERVRPGCVILFHDALFVRTRPEKAPKLARPRHPDRETMLTAIEMFLGRCDGQFRFVTIPELFRRARPVLQNWYIT
jgi:peptidoglycan-N-acetylglucosamine deacetylase